MLFQRRDKEPLSQRIKIALWPRRNWWRSIKYILLRVLRLTATPHVIAMGVAAGVFASFTPYLGCHFVIAFTICFFTRGSYFAGAAGTFFGNPLTFPFIWASTLAAGNYVLDIFGGTNTTAITPPALSFDLLWNSFATVWPVIKAMTIGAFPIGVPISVVAYFIVRQMAKVYKHSRLKMLTDRARESWASKLDDDMEAMAAEVAAIPPEKPRLEADKKLAS